MTANRDHQAPPNRMKASLPYRALRSIYHFRQTARYARLRQRWRKDSAAIADYLATASAPALQIGCGDNPLPGWLNTEYFPDRADLVHLDATGRFPFPDASFDRVYSEHVIEHLPLDGGINLLAESCRVLRPGGRIRISTPPLEFLVSLVEQPDAGLNPAYMQWHSDRWLQGAPLRGPAVVINDFVRNWGHLFIYDEPTLRSAMSLAGFTDLKRCSIDESGAPELVGLENVGRMPAGLLQLHTMTIEGVKPQSARIASI